MTHPLVLDQDNGLWVSTDSGLLLLNRDTGGVMARFGVSNSWRCLSEALPWKGGALVVVERASGRCALMYVDKSRGVLDETPLPPLRRARLYGTSNGEVWLVGSTASAVDALTETDRVLVFTRDVQGHLTGRFTLPGDRSIDGTLGSDGSLWLSTYTGDEEERGALYLLNREGALLLQWSPPSPSGVAAPLLLNETTIQVTTSNGLACLKLEQTEQQAELLPNDAAGARL
ncbi:hypothetical protein F0U62_05475 [Cystobacter fuscus]|uniref:hypothetical protein n=1 Tax=Cystobacter fuscus TaxID=43 RepID=UPI002B293BBC|nr:hypothetical protein F0U62_05475 [Cystobacter fuscus]